MEYKIYLDYTIELLSQIKIPSYIIDAPHGIIKLMVDLEITFSPRILI